MFQVFARNGETGAMIDQVEVSAFTWERLLSAGGSGSVSIPITGEYTKADLRRVTDHWNVIYELAYNGVSQYMGYVIDRGYDLASGTLQLKLSDLWAMCGRRGAWDHAEPHVEKWKVTRSVSLAQHAADALIRGRDTGFSPPRRGIPVTIPGFGGAAVARTIYGYHLQMIDEVFADLMDEGLDIFFEPRQIGNGSADWLMHAAPNWRSGRVREYYVSVPLSPVSAFTEQSDGARVTNNAVRIGEGSEQDMLARSNRNVTTSYPLLERITASKQVSDLNVLTAQANADLALYRDPTVQWNFSVPIAEGLQVGDTVRLHFAGDPWITDGWHERRVVKVSGDMSEFVKISCQPTGGA